MAQSGEDTSRILYWLMTALLGIAMAAGGFWMKELHGRIEAYNSRENQRFETTAQTSSARWERLSVLEARVASIEPRVNDLATKLSAMEARLPLVESKVTQADARLVRIEEKLDLLLRARSPR